MKLIIDMDENLYSYISKEDAVYFPDDGGELFETVKNGTPLQEELEKIKAEINEKDRQWLPKRYIFELIDNRIKELKGEKQEENHYKLENNITKEEAFKIIRNACDKAIEELKGKNNETDN